MSDSAPKVVSYAQTWLFIMTIVILGALFLVAPRQAISQDEKRKLAGPPVFSIEGFFSGKFSDQAEAFYNDNFLFRDRWLAAADHLTSLRGFKSDFEVVREAASLPPPTLDGIERATPVIPVDEEYQKVRAVIISKGRAIQVFGGSKTTVQPFAELINRYQNYLARFHFYPLARTRQ